MGVGREGVGAVEGVAVSVRRGSISVRDVARVRVSRTHSIYGTGTPPPTYPKGRVCAEPGCGTILTRYNPDPYCSVHGHRTATAARSRTTTAARVRNLTCENCGAAFTSRSQTARFCSARCRMAAYEAREAAKGEEMAKGDRDLVLGILREAGGAYAKRPQNMSRVRWQRAVDEVRGMGYVVEGRTGQGMRLVVRNQGSLGDCEGKLEEAETGDVTSAPADGVPCPPETPSTEEDDPPAAERLDQNPGDGSVAHAATSAVYAYGHDLVTVSDVRSLLRTVSDQETPPDQVGLTVEKIAGILGISVQHAGVFVDFLRNRGEIAVVERDGVERYHYPDPGLKGLVPDPWRDELATVDLCLTAIWRHEDPESRKRIAAYVAACYL